MPDPGSREDAQLIAHDAPVAVGTNVRSAGADAIFDSPSLVNALIQRPQEAVSLLKSQIGPVSLSDIFIDTHGKVVVRNEQFAKSVATLLGEESLEGNNIGCGAQC